MNRASVGAFANEQFQPAMQLPAYFLFAVFLTVISVLGTGIVLAAFLDRFLRTERTRSRPELLFVLAIGLYWNAVSFIVMFVAGADPSRQAIDAKFLVEATAVLLTVLLNSASLRAVLRSIADDAFTLVCAGGCALLGVWAMLQFPHVLDSGQILWTQQVIDSGIGAQPISAMMGYSGLVIGLAAFFADSPVVATAVAFKPLLFILYGCLAAQLGSLILKRYKAVTALCFVLLSLCSTFGTYGLVELGKDSIWGILLAIAFIATMCREDASKRGIELGLYFATASTLGVIAMPYMLAAYSLWLITSEPERRNANTILPLLLVCFPILPTVLAGFLNIGLASSYVGYGFFLLLAIAGTHLGLSRRLLAPMLVHVARWRAFIPAACALASVCLFPVALSFPVWTNADGTVFTESRPPLDGATSFWGYITSYGAQDTTVIAAVCASLVVGFTPMGKRNPGLVAAAAMPFFVLLLGLARAHLGIPIISDFNVWDLIKDIPLWLGGSLLVFTLLATIAALCGTPSLERAYPVLLLATTAGCLYMAQKAISPGYFVRPVTFNMYASYANADMANVANIAWKDFRGQTLWMDRQIAEANRYFYYFQMYGARPSFLDPNRLDIAINSGERDIGLIVRNDALGRLVNEVRSRKGSLRYLGRLEGNEGSVIAVSFDGNADIQLPNDLDAVLVTEGRYDREVVGRQSFYWMRADSQLRVVAPGVSLACVELNMFSTGRIAGAQIATVTNDDGQQASVNIEGHQPETPARLDITVRLEHGTASLSLHSTGGEASFPNDSRQVAFALLAQTTIREGACPTR